jgi:hypothetical protein
VEGCLAPFKALEDDTAPDAKIHGRDRPATLSRTHPEEFSKLARTFVNSSMAMGYHYAHDLNALDVEGVSLVPQAMVGSRRI